MIITVVLVSIVILLLGYVFYGRFLANRLQLNDSNPTPACTINDGVDYVPAKPAMLLGQHLSAISAAGPIVGPILAALWFGWLPALIWIVVGSIFIGGVHDFSCLVASIRHKAASIGQIVRQYMSRTSYILFLSFVWLALVYVIIAFTDITAQTFKTMSAEVAFGPGVAASSVLYIMLSVIMGVLLYRFNLNLKIATAIFVPLILFVVWLGPQMPAPILNFLMRITVKQWDAILLVYCFAASVMPMWILLQPRGYLGGWLLYLTIFIGLIGAIFGGFDVQYPSINTEGIKSIVNGKPLFPILFITVACGACSGFHAIVNSGTTSKQLRRESDAKPVGYGAMLLEGLLAVLALATVMMLPGSADILKEDPNLIYAHGIAKYLNLVGINFNMAFPFALLAFSTFVYDTLDVSTRLARYILQELLGLQTKIGGIIATVITLAFPLAFLTLTKEKGYMLAWPIFGISNQLLASLALLAISVWLIKTGKKSYYAVIPMIFMMSMTLWSLIRHVAGSLFCMFDGSLIKPDMILSAIFGIILFALSLWLIWEAVRVLVLRPKGSKELTTLSTAREIHERPQSFF
ncbi:MAG TPA: carbon starvation CstA family protein [Candidatus Wunengus sp. YC60]|uniref:carbon starvation CstA family protein n=1 Tax=Candidatus Wunengus sp. YC60 TaxID=3367697 RepID=UPI0040281FCB